jgi:hypothetical protein
MQNGSGAEMTANQMGFRIAAIAKHRGYGVGIQAPTGNADVTGTRQSPCRALREFSANVGHPDHPANQTRAPSLAQIEKTRKGRRID